jgi:hypothetical protein
MMRNGLFASVALAMCIVTSSGSAQVGPLTLWVDADSGNDSVTSGSESLPYATVNYALQQTWTKLAAGITVSAVKVQHSDIPIAPLGFGSTGQEGLESFGWVEVPGTTPPRSPFPIRMIAGVDLIGVPNSTTAAKPHIVIDEIGEGTAYLDWTVIPPPGAAPGTVADFWSVVRGATGAKLQGFELDGSGLIDRDFAHSNWPGVFATRAPGFQIDSCNIHGFHDQVCLFTPLYSRMHATITETVLADAWPFSDIQDTLAIDESDQGHANLWIIGDGTFNVALVDVALSNAHDGVEVGTQTSGSTFLTLMDCRFDRTENGLEIVGSGYAEITIGDSKFLRNYNRVDDGGTPFAGGSTGAILFRGQIETITSVRSCAFRSCAYGILGPLTPESQVDLGTSESHGLNNFCLDYALFMDNSKNPFRVSLYHRYAGVLPAAGNFWIHDNQGANGAGHLTAGTVTGSVNDPPPGPQVGEFIDQSLGLKWARNYSLGSASSIDFGTAAPAGPTPDCSVDP